MDDLDRTSMLEILAHALSAYDARAFAFCLMGNHYHLVLQTHRANLSLLMQRINGDYSQRFNRRHGRSGHLFEARFAAVHVDRDPYLLAVCRYVDLNPVRAGLVRSPAQWAWSSYRGHVGVIAPPAWLATAELHDALMGVSPPEARGTEPGQRAYSNWVDAGCEVQLWRTALRKKRYLGDEAFIERIKRLAS